MDLHPRVRQIRQRSALNHTLATMGSQDSVRWARRIQRALTKLYAITKGWLVRFELALYHSHASVYGLPRMDSDDYILKNGITFSTKRSFSEHGETDGSLVWRRHAKALTSARWLYRIGFTLRRPPGTRWGEADSSDDRRTALRQRIS